ncbi:DUF444 family protein [Bacillus pumilus]|uniref:DUF444 family protein n=1 Tax=Bacillus pumilus TaxID=1408 RepID=UPI003F689C4C
MRRLLGRKYERVDIEFIGDDTEGKVVDEEDLLWGGERGGRICWSVYGKGVEVIEEGYPGWRYNIYRFDFCDGENLR